MIVSSCLFFQVHEQVEVSALLFVVLRNDGEDGDRTGDFLVAEGRLEAFDCVLLENIASIRSGTSVLLCSNGHCLFPAS